MSISGGHGFKKILLFFLFCGLFGAVISSGAFVYTNPGHDCLGKDCPVCIQIRGAQKPLKNLSLAGAGLFLAVWLTFIFAVSKPFLLLSPVTPIGLKVRLNT
ncbi:MAG: hypothetical protein LBD55_08785 [Treponema sp.]|jgi:hypothetical protein|nr:hypothetical protein [Treponema sp.]